MTSIIYDLLFLLSSVTRLLCFNSANGFTTSPPHVAIGVYQDVRVFINTIPSLKTFIINPLLSYGYQINLFIVLACRHQKRDDFYREQTHIQLSLDYHGILGYVTVFEFYEYGESEKYIQKFLKLVEKYKNHCQNPCRELFQQYYMRNKLNMAINRYIDGPHSAMRNGYDLIVYARSDLIWGNNFWKYFDNGKIINNSFYHFNNTVALPFAYRNAFKVWISNAEHIFGGLSDRFMIMTSSYFKYYSENFEQKLVDYLHPPKYSKSLIDYIYPSKITKKKHFVYDGLANFYFVRIVHGENINRYFLTNSLINDQSNVIEEMSVCYGILRHHCSFTDYGETSCAALNLPTVRHQFSKQHNYSKYAVCGNQNGNLTNLS